MDLSRSRRVISVGVTVFLAMLAYPAQAWGPITHAYIVCQAVPDAPPIALFGAMSADMNDCSGWGWALGKHFKRLTHFEAGLIAPSPFQLGLLTHNSEWGGDSYAHAYFHTPTDKLYPMRIFEQLSRETGISMNDAEDFIETLMDYVICRDLGLAFVHRIAEAANAAGAQEEQMLIDAFTQPLMDKMPELGREQAVDLIRSIFRCDAAFLRQTAELMTMPSESLMRIAPTLLAAGSGIDMAKAAQCVQRGVELCADWRGHLDEISKQMAEKMQSLGLLGG